MGIGCGGSSGRARTLAALNHPNILTIYDADVYEGTPYLVSELLEGKTLREELGAGNTALPIRKATDYALQIAQGLAAAHGRGIIHRDLKPENIFITKDGRVKILDFGLAKLQSNLKSESSNPKFPDEAAPTVFQTTEPGLVLGTLAYMSPEQVRGEHADHRSDIFALGCVLYEMLTGNGAFRRRTPVESMHAVLRDEPPGFDRSHPGVPSGLESLIRRCLEKQPDGRFQSARDLSFSIDAVSSKGQTSERDGPASMRPLRLGIGVAGFLLLLGVFGFAGGVLWSERRLVQRSPTAPSIRYLTYSGRDFSPAVSADGKRVCFSSDRTGTMRIGMARTISPTVVSGVMLFIFTLSIGTMFRDKIRLGSPVTRFVVNADVIHNGTEIIIALKMYCKYSFWLELGSHSRHIVVDATERLFRLCLARVNPDRVATSAPGHGGRGC